jgi:hypothetical protein
MIAPAKVQEIERLLAEGTMSQRRVARQAGVSRATVKGIAGGSRPDYEARRLARRQFRKRELPGPLVRCGECGGRVYAPCRLCRVRRFKAAEQARAGLTRRAAGHSAWREMLAAPGTRRAKTLVRTADPRKAG